MSLHRPFLISRALFVLLLVLLCSSSWAPVSSQQQQALHIQVPASGITVAGQQYQQPVELHGVLQHGAKIIITGSSFVSLRIFTTMQRGVSVLIDGNKFQSGFEVSPGLNFSECTPPVSNKDLLSVVVTNNVVTGVGLVQLEWPPTRVGITIFKLLVCVNDKDVPGGGFAGVDITVSDNTVANVEPSQPSECLHYRGIHVYGRAQPIWPEYNTTSPEYSELVHTGTFARINTCSILRNKVSFTCASQFTRGEETVGTFAITVGGGVDFWFTPRLWRNIFLPSLSSSSSSGPITRRLIIANNDISIACEHGIIAGIEAAGFGGATLTPWSDDAGYTNVHLEVHITGNKLDMRAFNLYRAIRVAPVLPSVFFNIREHWVFDDVPVSTTGKSFDDAANFLFPHLLIRVADNAIQAQFREKDQSSFCDAVVLNVKTVQRNATVVFESNVIKHTGHRCVAFALRGRFTHVLARGNSLSYAPSAATALGDRVALDCGVHWAAADEVMSLIPPSLRRVAFVRVEKHQVVMRAHTIPRAAQTGLSVLMIADNGTFAVFDVVVVDRVSITANPATGAFFPTLLWGIVVCKFSSTGNVGRVEVTNIFIAGDEGGKVPLLTDRLSLFSAGENGPPLMGSFVADNCTVRALPYSPASADDDIKITFFYGFGYVTGSFIVRRLRLTALMFNTVFLMAGPVASPLLVIEDSIFTFLAATNAWLLAFDPVPVSVTQSRIYLPRLELLRNFVNISGGIGAAVYSIGLFTTGKDDFARYAPIDLSSLGVSPIYAALIPSDSPIIRPLSKLSLDVASSPPFDAPPAASPRPPAMWLLAENVVHLRAPNSTSVFLLFSIHVPRIVLTRNTFWLKLFSRRENPFGSSLHYQNFLQVRAVLAQIHKVQGTTPPPLDSPPTVRFCTMSYVTVAAFDLGDPVEGLGGCSFYNGQRLSERILSRELERKWSGLVAAMQGDGVCGTACIGDPPRIIEAADGKCAFTASMPRTRSRSLALSESITNETATPAPTRTATASKTRRVIVIGETAATRQSSSIISSFAAAGAILGPTIALDAGVALSILSLVRRCSQFGVAAAETAGDAAQRELIERQFAAQYLNRPLAWPENFFGINLESTRNNNSSRGAKGAERAGDGVGKLKGAVLGGFLLILLAALASLASGFASARSTLRQKALESWREKEHKRKQREREESSQNRRHVVDTAADSDFEEENLTEEQEQRAKAHEEKIVARVKVAIVDVLAHARLPWSITLVTAMQLSTWITNATAILVAPSWGGVRVADRIFLGALPVLFWAVGATVFIWYLQQRGLSRNFPRHQDATQLSSRSSSSSSSCCCSCMSPMTRANALQLEPLRIWCQGDYDRTGHGGWKAKVAAAVRDSSWLQWLMVPQFVWGQGPSSRSIANGALGSFARGAGSVLNKHHGVHSYQLARELQKIEERSRRRSASRSNSSSSSSNGREQQSTSRLSHLLAMLRCRVAPFTVFISSVFVVISGSLSAITAIHPRACVGALAALLVTQLLSAIVICAVRPFLLGPVNVCTGLYGAFLFFAVCSALSVIVRAQNADRSVLEELVDGSGVAVTSALVSVSIALVAVKGVFSIASKLLPMLCAMHYATPYEAETVLDKAEKERRTKLSRQAAKEAQEQRELRSQLDNLMTLQRQSSLSRRNSNSRGDRSTEHEEEEEEGEEEMTASRLPHHQYQQHQRNTEIAARRHRRNSDLEEDFIRRPSPSPPQLPHRNEPQYRGIYANDRHRSSPTRHRHSHSPVPGIDRHEQRRDNQNHTSRRLHEL